MMIEYKIVSQFTEDTYAKEDHICNHPVCRAKIRKGMPYFYVATIEPGQPECNLCVSYHAHYKKNPVTLVRPIHQAEKPCPFASAQGSINNHIPDLCAIQQLVNTAKQKCSSQSASPIGYLSQHGLYAIECKHQAKMAYATGLPPVETILIKISAVHEGGGHKKHGVSIGVYMHHNLLETW
ncbi:uncharacterized protein BJ212DRAFT_1304753 [Suillus subaureus]|uniref:Uncharacterized protein n=1 Tax=Suillus subaureus TaxID=48587 RepID=A0A9P7DU65_9AGAM|nr:uncharacterized protein BJ212DRAFT_1304753 [Suillus subaureus]KAG1802974.1 hypothetical protein BJ212DRAFT_1304753 [Suillus subaureus]